MNLTQFQFDTNEVRALVDERGEPWFVAADIAAVLEIGRTDDAVRRLDDDEKGTDIIRIPGGDQAMTIINESGLSTYEPSQNWVLFSLPKQKPSRSWVFLS